MVIAEANTTEERYSLGPIGEEPYEGARELRRELARVLAGEAPSGAVRADIVRSWQESAERGLMPDRFDPPFVGTDEKDTRLIQAATPAIERLANDLTSTEVSVVLAGEGCRVIAERAPGPVEEERLGSLKLSPGYLWDIGHAGTNGLGAAFSSGSPWLVQGDEHFADVLTTIATAAAPVRDPHTAQVLGVLAFVCSVQAASPLLLPMVTRAVREVEQRLVHASSGVDQLVQAKFLDARRRTRGPVAAVSEDTFLTNAAAARILPVADRSRFWDFVSSDLSASGSIYRPFTLADGSAVKVSVEPILDGQQVVGALVQLGGSSHDARSSSRSRPSKSFRPTFGWDSLTQAEHSVMELVAEGLTNREVAARLFLSPHTVDSHLRHIFRKLDINSRVDLVRMVTARSMVQGSLIGAADVA